MHTWTRATGEDVTKLVALSQRQYEREIDVFYTPDPIVMSRNLTRAVVEQFYDPNREYVVCAKDNGTLIAYLWLVRGQYTPWSDDEVLDWRIAHLDLELPAKTRVRLVNEMIDQSILFAHHNNIPVIVSSSVRDDQAGFLKLHERRGFTVRGSIAYLKLPSSQQ